MDLEYLVSFLPIKSKINAWKVRNTGTERLLIRYVSNFQGCISRQSMQATAKKFLHYSVIVQADEFLLDCSLCLFILCLNYIF